MQIKYERPKRIRGVFVFKIDSKFLSNLRLNKKLLKEEKNKFFFQSGYENKNKFFFWLARIKNWGNQKEAKIRYNIQPTETYFDKENNNLIDFFDFSTKLKRKFQLRIDFELKVYETKLKIDFQKVKKYDKNSLFYKRYTKDEKYLEQINEIKKLAQKIVGKEKNYFKRARKIFNWIIENLSYKYPPKERGVIPTLQKKCGDCGEFSFLFITLCRSLGIPARFVSGMWATPLVKQGFHAWAEFYLEGVGWIPVDCSVSQAIKMKTNKEFFEFLRKIENPIDPDYYFGNLDNKRIIFSKGTNILLKNCPQNLSKLKMMENCRSLFMQPDSIYPFITGKQKGIFIVEISPELIIL